MAKGAPRRPQLLGDGASSVKADAECSGGLSPIIRSVTLLAVVGMGGASGDVGGGISSTGDTRPDAEALTLFLPKVSFHFDGFLLGTGGVGGAEITWTGGGAVLRTDGGGALRIAGDEALRTGGEGTLLRGAASKAEGMAKIDTGSNGSRLAEELEAFVDTDIWIDEDLDALLISRANDCEASAKLASASPLGVVATEPLPFRAPLFLRLLVDVDLDASRSRPWSYWSSNS